MKTTIKDLALAFSGGEFVMVYPFLTDSTEWNIVGEKILKGKDEIVKFCDETARYFSGVTTDFRMSNLVVGDNTVAIDGTAEFITAEGKQSSISSCDVYRFENEKLVQINSYCIRGKK